MTLPPLGEYRLFTVTAFDVGPPGLRKSRRLDLRPSMSGLSL